MYTNVKCMVINFEDNNIQDLLWSRTFTLSSGSQETLRKIKEYLRNHISVKINFNELDLSTRDSFVEFLSGMSTYFGAKTKLVWQ
jgi:hypothetical protein